MKVRDVMTWPVITAGPEASFKEAVELMLDHGVSGLPVVDDDGRLVGLVTEADVMSKEAFGGGHQRPLGALVDILTGERRWTAKADGLTAADVMTAEAVTTSPGEDIRAAARRMLDRGVKRLPVVEEGQLVGIVSRSDLLRVFHRSDAQLAAEIGAKLRSPLHCPEDHHVSFTVEDGVVILTGTVRYDGDARVVEAMAGHVPGVVHVVSALGHELSERG